MKRNELSTKIKYLIENILRYIKLVSSYLFYYTHNLDRYFMIKPLY